MDYTEINFIERSQSRPQSRIFIFAADLRSMCALRSVLGALSTETRTMIYTIIASSFAYIKSIIYA